MARRDARTKRFTVYDVMEASGVFEENPANMESPDFKGPLQFPMMYYHPLGEERVVVPAEAIETPSGVKWVGEQRELVFQIANNRAEAQGLIADGWHDHPAKAIAAARDPSRPVPPISTASIISDKEARIRELEDELAAARGAYASTGGAGGAGEHVESQAKSNRASVLRDNNPLGAVPPDA